MKFIFALSLTIIFFTSNAQQTIREVVEEYGGVQFYGHTLVDGDTVAYLMYIDTLTNESATYFFDKEGRSDSKALYVVYFLNNKLLAETRKSLDKTFTRVDFFTYVSENGVTVELAPEGEYFRLYIDY